MQSLELLHRAPRNAARDTPLLFIHGAYAGAWCWEEHFLPYFAKRGWHAYAMSLSGHGASRGRHHLDALSIENYVDDVREIAASLPARPVLIGHSMGGMVVQKFLELENAPGAVLMSAVPPQGLAIAAMGLLFHQPGLLMDLNRTLGGGQPHLETLREALFYQPVSLEYLLRCYHRMQPESLRALWDMMFFNLPQPARMHRPPMLILGAEHDKLIPAVHVTNTGRAYGIEVDIIPAIGHGMMLESNWIEPARRLADWLIAHGF